MKVKKLTDFLESRYPAEMAENWDNVGLLVGDDEKEVRHVFLALDLTEKVLVEAAEAGAGSGTSMIGDVLKKGADVYITGDIDHHTGIDAVAQDLAVIDAGHYGTEYIFMEAMKNTLAENFPELKVSCARVESPYKLL